MDLAQTLWIAFDKKQPDYPELIIWVRSNYVKEFIQLEIIEGFNNHLQKTLELEMLVAMKDGKVLEELSIVSFIHKSEMQDYQQAMESVLYEGFNKYEDVKLFGDHYVSETIQIIFSEGTININKVFQDRFSEYIARNDGKISDMTGQPITLNWWKEVLR